MATAYFSAGCFWGVEYYFKRLKGVVHTSVGFMGGTVPNPSYQQVKTGTTGHLETIEVDYEPRTVPYEALVRYFFEIHNFEQMDGQGIDIGSQYLSAIWVGNPQEQFIAIKVIDELTRMGYKVATQVRSKETFFPAENYHQDYLDQRQETPECHVYRKIFGANLGTLTLIDQTSKMGMTLPHKIYFNDRLLGVMQRKEIQVNDIPEGSYRLKIQSMFPFIYAEKEIHIQRGENQVTFSDREKFWDILFTIDLLLVVVKWFVHLPDNINFIYNIVTNGYFAVWLVYEWVIRKRYFKMEEKP